MNLVHIGLQRTGNSLLKNAVFSKLGNYLYIGKWNERYPNDHVRELINRISFQDSLDYEPAGVKRLLNDIRGTDARPTLISDEIFSVEGRADRRLIADRLHELFAPAKVLIVLRSQTTMVQAIYLKHLAALGSRIVPFERWLEENYGRLVFRDVHRMHLNYEPLVRLYCSVFGSENVVVLPSELAHDEASNFARDVAGLLGVSVDSVRESLRINRTDQRVSRRVLMIHRLESVLPAGTNLALTGRGVLPATLYERIKRYAGRGAPLGAPPLSQEWQRRITEICGQGNLMLERATGLPLRNLGYPMPPRQASA